MPASPDEPTVSIPVRRDPGSRLTRRGTTILFDHYPDGTVAASYRGVSGVGRTAAEALADLERRLGDTPPVG
jgi:hypothetical protein